MGNNQSEEADPVEACGNGGAVETDGAQATVTRIQLVDPAASEADGLTSVIRRLSTAHTLGEVMAVTVQAARALVGADGVTFVLRDGDLCYYADEDSVGPLWKGERFPAASCISGWVMKHCEAVRIPDIEQDERIPQDAYRPTFVKSLAMVPIRKEEPVGAMGAYWARIHSASTDELERLQTIANAAALAIAYVERCESEAELRDREAGRQLLVRELDHRVKNVFALVGAMVGLTAGNSKSVKAMSRALSGRIEALAQAHDLIRPALDPPSAHDETELGALVDQLLAPHRGEEEQCRVSGPALAIGVAAAARLALVIHELATNAAKYGALSTPSGSLRVEWREQGERLELTWEEEGGPRTGDAPGEPGFGTKLIDETVRQLGGAIRHSWEARGLRVKLSVPLKSLRDDGAA